MLVSTKTSAFIQFLTRNGGGLAKSCHSAKQFTHACPSGSSPRLLLLGLGAFKQIDDFLVQRRTARGRTPLHAFVNIVRNLHRERFHDLSLKSCPQPASIDCTIVERN